MIDPRLLLDEMLSGTIADQLRRRGYDVVAVVDDVSLVSTSDQDLLAHATDQQRVLVTANIADFTAIASDWRTGGRVHHGIIYVAYRTFGQDRSFIGAVVDVLGALYRASALPPPGTETFLRRAPVRT
ncbi:MAG: DUF5615 family PIN-like protein [Mycobacteriales bacterium]|nr:MAG: hypothetical protein DLM56_10110 [Pseudonocardiales bacterium]